MDRRIGRVLKLLRYKIFLRLGSDLQCLIHGTADAQFRIRQHQFRTQCVDDLFAFLAHILRHHDDHAIAFPHTTQCQADSGIAAGRFDDRHSRFQLSGLFRIFDHIQCNTVFDTAAGI